MTKFADQLLHDLILDHGDTLSTVHRPVARQRRTVRRPVWVAGLAAGAAGAGTAGVVLLGGTPADAVTQNGDGTVKIAVNRQAGIAGANAALHKKGLKVVVVPARAGCPDLSSLATPVAPGTKVTASSRTGDDGSIVVDTSGVPAGQTALVGVESANGRTTLSMALITGTAPECVSLPTAPPPVSGSSNGGSPDGGPSLSHDGQDDQGSGPSTKRAGS